MKWENIIKATLNGNLFRQAIRQVVETTDVPSPLLVSDSFDYYKKTFYTNVLLAYKHILIDSGMRREATSFQQKINNKSSRHLPALRQYLKGMYEIKEVKRKSGAGAILHVFTDKPKN
tara:strand:- start:126 stop:479 length:354 start_codon:yes stop_codon:yes gene_type:complete